MSAISKYAGKLSQSNREWSGIKCDKTVTMMKEFFSAVETWLHWIL